MLKERKCARKEDSLQGLSEDETIPQNPQVVGSDDDDDEEDGIPFLDLDKKSELYRKTVNLFRLIHTS